MRRDIRLISRVAAPFSHRTFATAGNHNRHQQHGSTLRASSWNIISIGVALTKQHHIRSQSSLRSSSEPQSLPEAIVDREREPLLPNHRLLARAFHRAPAARALSTSTRNRKWEGRQPEEHVTNEGDRHNVQHDASREGKRDRAEGDAGKGSGSRAATEKSGNSNEKAREEFPEAPDTIGMQDERGGKA